MLNLENESIFFHLDSLIGGKYIMHYSKISEALLFTMLVFRETMEPNEKGQPSKGRPPPIKINRNRNQQ
ncbi:hypothetical protein [Brevibacillus sp. NRS-1366]|uniref:hypothetical protein n=1 Tax=Brevibacillus sp. NRS-1366 TaxID=3233899 RepID=UPI003D25A191